MSHISPECYYGISHKYGHRVVSKIKTKTTKNDKLQHIGMFYVSACIMSIFVPFGKTQIQDFQK